MNKKLLVKLMELNTAQANTYLLNFANEIKTAVHGSKDNDVIFEKLDLLQEFIYRVPEQAIDIINNVLSKKPNKPKKIWREYYGKNQIDLICKCIDLANEIRYMKTDRVLEILLNFSKSDDKKVSDVIKKVISNLSKYDFYVLKKIGCGAQKRVLDVISSWESRKKVQNVEFIKIIAVELLHPSFEGISMQDYKTMVFKSGPLPVDSTLKKIRRDTVGLLLDLYGLVGDLKEKVEILEVLYNASDLPLQMYGDDMKAMILSDMEFLVEEYKKVIFDNKGKVIAEAPIIQEIERQLVWFNNKKQESISKKIDLFLSKIRKDEFYDLYRTLVGDTISIERLETNWTAAEEKIRQKIEKEFKKINSNNIDKWVNNLNMVAQYNTIVDEWKFQNFNNFLFRIAKEKSSLSEKILEDALVHNKPLKIFVGHFLRGLREAKKISSWNRFVKLLSKSENVNLLINIPMAISAETINEADISLLSALLKKENPFEFLSSAEESVMFKLHFFIARSLVYSVNTKYASWTENLIIELIRANKKNLQMIIHLISYPAFKGDVNLAEWEPHNVKFILENLVEIKNIDFEVQSLLFSIAKINFPSVMELFYKRIQRAANKKERKIDNFLYDRYDAIPYRFDNKEFSQLISEHEDFLKIVMLWIKKMGKKTTIYNIELAQFFRALGGVTHNLVLMEVIEKGDRYDLKRVADLMWGVDSANIEICLEIIKRTDDKDLWAHISGIMHSTGVVSGEYGISEAYEKKAKDIEVYKAEGTTKEISRVIKFKEMAVRELREMSRRERERSDEELRIRKMGFEEHIS